MFLEQRKLINTNLNVRGFLLCTNCACRRRNHFKCIDYGLETEKKKFFFAKKNFFFEEWLVTAFAKKCERDGARADGCNSADLIRSFRQRFKLNVQLAIVSGLGGMLLTAGQPFGHDV